MLAQDGAGGCATGSRCRAGSTRYRDYIGASRGEFTVAKDQNVRLRTGWFSDRSATYLASGRPVVTQDTGFGSALPTGEGLFAFSSLDAAAEAVEEIDADYTRHARAAREVAREHFGHEAVLAPMLEELGIARAKPAAGRRPSSAVSRRHGARADLPPADGAASRDGRGGAAKPGRRPRGPTDARPRERQHRRRHPRRTAVHQAVPGKPARPHRRLRLRADRRRQRLRWTAPRPTSPSCVERDARVRVVLNGRNMGFASACNQGLGLAGGEHLVLLNNDTMVPPGWLGRLLDHLRNPGVGLVGPVTNRIGNEAEIVTDYRTWGEFLEVARQRAEEHAGEWLEVESAGDVLPRDAPPDPPSARAARRALRGGAARGRRLRRTGAPGRLPAALRRGRRRPPLRRGVVRQARPGR